MRETSCCHFGILTIIFSIAVRIEQAHDTACCLTAPAGSLSCFYQNDGLLNSSYCIDPLLIMDPSYTSPSSIYSDPERCYDTCTHSDFTCIHPRSDEQLMRISHAPFGVHVADREVLVWRGPVSEIWDHGDYPSAPSIRIRLTLAISGGWQLPSKN